MENSAPFCGELPKKKFHKEIRRAVDKVLDEMAIGTRFSGGELPKMCAAVEPICANTEGETLRRYMRYWRTRRTCDVICVDRANSIYMKVSKE